MTISKTAFVRLIAVTVFASLSASCGWGDEQAARKEAAAVEQAKKAKAKSAPAVPDDGLANAVAVGKAGAAVDMRYGLGAKPAVGPPFEVELAFIPRVAAESLEVEVTGMPGLAVAGGATATFEKVHAGERYVAKVLLQVEQDGVYYFSVVVKLASQVQTDVRTFSVPIVAGPAPAEEKPAVAADAGATAPGETVKSVPAAETTKQ